MPISVGIAGNVVATGRDVGLLFKQVKDKPFSFDIAKSVLACCKPRSDKPCVGRASGWDVSNAIGYDSRTWGVLLVRSANVDFADDDIVIPAYKAKYSNSFFVYFILEIESYLAAKPDRSMAMRVINENIELLNPELASFSKSLNAIIDRMDSCFKPKAVCSLNWGKSASMGLTAEGYTITSPYSLVIEIPYRTKQEMADLGLLD